MLLSKKITQVINEFRRDVLVIECTHTTVAHQCHFVSNDFEKYANGKGINVKSIYFDSNGKICKIESSTLDHRANILGSVIIDWTAAQYDYSLAIPLIAKVSDIIDAEGFYQPIKSSKRQRLKF